jgi:16S rRNA A1518/A1519 N6-dimethyltransferase RsmA/KsgA/DIM1 with predicted DNA glycosylase/AP lyase activity
MDVFTFVIIVVIIGCGTGVLTEYFKTKREAGELEGDEEVYAELESLRARVEVLEAIVTDQKYNLKKEIDQLERRA